MKIAEPITRKEVDGMILQIEAMLERWDSAFDTAEHESKPYWHAVDVSAALSEVMNLLMK